MYFPATIKLISGEEIFAIVETIDENNKKYLLAFEPIVITPVRNLTGDYGYKVEPWLKTADDDTFILEKKNILTLSECKNKDLIKLHESYITRKNSNPYEETLTRKQGYISNVDEMRNKLENLL
jgi:hypothetical protein